MKKRDSILMIIIVLIILLISVVTSFAPTVVETLIKNQYTSVCVSMGYDGAFTMDDVPFCFNEDGNNEITFTRLYFGED